MGQYDRKAQSQPKHGKPSSSGASKAGPPIPVGKPEWRGSGYVKKKSARQQAMGSKEEAPAIQEQPLSIKTQQTLLDIFRISLPIIEALEELKPTLHDINTNLIDGDITDVLNTQQRCECYALRWSPSRCLTYANVLRYICSQHEGNAWFRAISNLNAGAASNAICFGSSVATGMALVGFLHAMRPDLAGKPGAQQDTKPGDRPANRPVLKLQLIDQIDWSLIMRRLVDVSTQPRPLSKYASASAIATNAAFIDRHGLGMAIQPVNPIDMDVPSLSEKCASMTDAVMICFFHTLSGYFRESIGKTTMLLRALTESVAKGSVLVIIDQIAAMVSIPVAGEDTRDCIMSELLDRILIGRAPSNNKTDEIQMVPPWTKLVDERAREHKIEKSLMYPASLDNLKFQYLVYERV